MKAIYACKLYKASSRKSKIQAAIADPLNLELVTQLKSYIDEEYQKIVDDAEAKEQADLVDNLTDIDDASQDELSSGGSTPPSGGFSGPAGGRPSLSEKFDMLMSGDEDEEDSLDDVSDEGNDVELDEGEEGANLDDIEESTVIEGVNEDIDTVEPFDVVEEVKSLLNSDDSTQDINRVLVKKNELWIHYNDAINLNNVMGPVIEKLAVCDYMDFNRLARSENAIVFQLNNSATLLMNGEDADGK